MEVAQKHDVVCYEEQYSKSALHNSLLDNTNECEQKHSTVAKNIDKQTALRNLFRISVIGPVENIRLYI